MSDSHETRRPHLLLITMDQWRRDTAGCYGHPLVKTPHLDAISRRGVRAEHAYTVCPLCMPARNSWITGRYSHQHGICGNVYPPIEPAAREHTFCRQLQRAGYQTALIGKHHFFDYFYAEGSFDYTTLEPQLREYGLDRVHQVLDVSENIRHDDDYTKFLADRGVLDDRRRAQADTSGADPFQSELSHDGHIGATAVEHIRDCDASTPQFLWASFIGPHPPYWTCEPYHSMYDRGAVAGALAEQDRPCDPATVERVARYLGMVTHIDEWIGRLVDALRERGMYEDTLIVVTADHGDLHGEFGQWDKRFFYEESVGVPLVAAGPGFQPPASASGSLRLKQLIESVDVPATLLEAAGTGPHPAIEPCPGIPLQSLLSPRAKPGERPLPYPAGRRATFSELGTTAMVRDAQWKLVYDPAQGGAVGLFHLLNDPREQTNLANRPEYADQQARLTQMLLNWYIQTTCTSETKENQRLQGMLSQW